MLRTSLSSASRPNTVVAEALVSVLFMTIMIITSSMNPNTDSEE